MLFQQKIAQKKLKQEKRKKGFITRGVEYLFTLYFSVIKYILVVLKDYLARYVPDFYWASQQHGVNVGASKIEIVEAVLDSESVKQVLLYDPHTHKISSSKRFLDQRREKARKMVKIMAQQNWPLVVRVMCYFLRKAFRVLYPYGIHVDENEVALLREYGKKGSLLILPTHKSHIDYLLVSYVLFENDISLPVIIAGDNLDLPIVGRLLRYAGALFIRRKFAGDHDPLYATIFREYIRQLLIHNRNLECFIEGGRSRSGKLLPPKTGVLVNVLEHMLNNEAEGEVYVVPISLSYDRIIENSSHVDELSGGK